MKLPTCARCSGVRDANSTPIPLPGCITCTMPSACTSKSSAFKERTIPDFSGEGRFRLDVTTAQAEIGQLAMRNWFRIFRRQLRSVVRNPCLERLPQGLGHVNKRTPDCPLGFAHATSPRT